MEAKVVKAFYDREAGVERKPGAFFEVSEKRFDAVNAAFPGTLEGDKPKRTRKKATEEK